MNSLGFPGGSDSKKSAWNAGDRGSIPGLGRPPGEGNGNPLQYSCLENSMDRGAWWTTVYGVAKIRTWLTERIARKTIQAQFGYHMSLPQNFSFQNPLDVKKPGKKLWTMKEANVSLGFSGGSAVKNPPVSAGDLGSVPGSGRSPSEGKGSPLQCSCPGNPRDRGAWQAMVHGVAKSWHDLATKQCFFSMCHVQGMVLSSLYTLTDLVGPITLWGGHYYYHYHAHFTDEETEAQRG